jgi:uncharacterized repeat protein (TIGR03847 family)
MLSLRSPKVGPVAGPPWGYIVNCDHYKHARHDLGVCLTLDPESVGEPGQRHFRLRASAENGSALLWLEKEELYELALTVKRVLRTGVRQTGVLESTGSTYVTADFDFKVEGLALAHDRATGRYLLLAQMSEDDEEDAVALWIEKDMLNRMADRAFEVHSAGRPRCPLCSGALNESDSHACPRAN